MMHLADWCPILHGVVLYQHIYATDQLAYDSLNDVVPTIQNVKLVLILFQAAN